LLGDAVPIGEGIRNSLDKRYDVDDGKQEKRRYDEEDICPVLFSGETAHKFVILIAC
jgi:hypothetical protein